MDKVQRKIAYLKGMADGLNVKKTDEGRVIKSLIGVIDELADEMVQLKGAYNDLEEYVEALDEDLNEVELDLYDDLEDDAEYDSEGYDDDDIGYFEVECPECQELVAIDQDIFENDDVTELLCPECHEVILVSDDELEDDEDDEDDEEYEMGTGYEMEENIDEPRNYT
jgi:DNA-directed RNA polymerase subunit delta